MKHVVPPFAIGLLAGCAPTLVPHAAYLPLIRDRGQAEARLSTGLNGSELQLAYQVTDKFVLHSALLNYRHGRSDDDKGFRSADLGLGYYYNSPNGFWRLGGHAGMAYGSGTSRSGCFDCFGPSSTYSVRYTYAYVQPTVLLLEGDQAWGFGLRVGRAYYHHFTKVGADTLRGPILTTSYAGRQITFVQPTFQYSYRVRRWLAFSGTFGSQGFLANTEALDSVNPFVGQLGIHFVLNKRSTPQP